MYPNRPVPGTAPWPDIDPALVEDARGVVPLFPLDLLPQPWLRLIKQASGPQGGRPPLRWRVNPALASSKRLPETPGNLGMGASPPAPGTGPPNGA